MSGKVSWGLVNRLRGYVGDANWNRAFPNGVRRVEPAPPAIIDGQKGYVPEATERGAPNTGNPWKGG